MADYDSPRPISQPVGSTDQAVLKDNLITLDNFTNGTDDVTNRLGKTITSLSNIEASAIAQITDYIEQVVSDTISSSTLSSPIEFIDDTYEYSISGFIAASTSYYIYHPDGVFNTQLLIPTIDYNYDSESTETITLTSSWSGGYILAKSLDPAGTGTYTPPGQYTSSEIASKTGLQDGTEITISDLGFAKYVISDTATAQAGDINLNSGQVAVLQDDGGRFNVVWFGGDPTGTDFADDAFNDAAERSLAFSQINGPATLGAVTIPVGLWRLSGPTTNSAIWFMECGAEMRTPVNLDNSNFDDTSYLTGKKVQFTARGNNMFHVGNTDPWIEGYRESMSSISAISGVSPEGRIGVSGHSRITDRGGDTGAGCIGVAATAWADQDEDFEYSAWAIYAESAKFHDVTGNAFAIESNVTNFTGAIQPITPDMIPVGTDKFTVNLWTGGPVGSAAADTPGAEFIYPASAAMVVSPGAAAFSNGGFDKGIVFLDASFVNGSKEILNYSQDHKMVAYSDDGTQLSYTVTINEGDNVGRHNIHVKDEDGDWVDFSFRQGSFSATPSTMALGTNARRWTTVYSVNSMDVSSDETLKELRDESGDLSEAEKAAAIKIAKLPKMFKWLGEIDKKTESETVYLHCSPMAQKVWSAMGDEGLDPTIYGFISDGGENGTYSIQPQEILWLICAAQQEQIEDIQTRLLALED